jgi:hypothetical protein
MPQIPFDVLFRVSNSIREDADTISAWMDEIDGRIDTLEAGGGAGSWFNVLVHGLENDGTTDNRVALRALLDLVLNAGGGTIYFPKGTYFVGIGGAGDRTSIPLTGKGNMNLRIVGDGPDLSIITWGGDAGGTDAHLFLIENGSSGLTVESMGFMQKNALTNPDGAEQHHCFSILTRNTANNERFKFFNCKWGVFKGDGIFMVGTQSNAECHTGFAANVSAGAISGTFNDPTVPQRVSVKFPAGWDGGNVTITGTDIQNQTITETFTAVANQHVTGFEYFKTVVSGTKSATGTSSAQATLGFAYEVRDVVVDSCNFDGFQFAGSAPGHGFRSCIVGQRLVSNVKITKNTFTGSSDQLIDFEPTGQGNLGAWFIVYNWFRSANPNGNNRIPTAVTLNGNGQTDQNTLEDSYFVNNFVWGRVKCSNGFTRMHIIGNHIVADTNEVSPEGVLTVEGFMRDCIVADNTIISRSTVNGNALVFVADRNSRASGLKIRDNTIRFFSGIGLKAENLEHTEISGNRLLYLGTATDTDFGIECGNTSIAVTNLTIRNNEIIGDAGGGTLKRGIRIGPGNTVATTHLDVSHNRGSGFGTAGIQIDTPSGSGSFSTLPVVIGNAMGITLGSGVNVIIGGNVGDVTLTMGGATSPEGVVTAIQGSEHIQKNGNSTVKFRKTSGTGNTGWVTP